MAPPTVGELAALLRCGRYAFDDEHDLQAEIARHLTESGMRKVAREVRLTPHDRVDLTVARIGIEVKVDGSARDLGRQCARYLATGKLDGLVIVTTRSSHRKLAQPDPPVDVVHVTTLNGTRIHKPAHDGRPGSVTFEDGAWCITAAPHVAMRIRRTFPRITLQHTGTFTIRSTPEVDRDLEWLLERWPLVIDPTDLERLLRGADTYRSQLAAVGNILTGMRLDAGDWRTPARKPRWEHQATNADLITAVQRLLIGDQLGAGKTYSALQALRNPDSLPAVVVCPTHLAHQWVREIRATWPDLTAEIIPVGNWTPKNADVTVVTYTRLARWVEYLTGAPTVMFDEAHELRHGDKTVKGTAAMVLAAPATYCVGLTATPVFNYGGEMHNIMSIVRPELLGSRDEFLREWCGFSDGSGKAIVRDPAALAGFLREQGAMVSAKLPPSEMVPILHEIDTDPATYEAASANARALARSVLDADTTRADRFTNSGQLDLLVRHATGVAKAPYVASFVEMLLETVDKVLLFGWHRDVYDIWLARLANHRPVMFTGTEDDKRKEASRTAFVDGDARILVMSLRSGAGLDGLQTVCSTAVVGELDWSPKTHDQAVGRVDRPGQEHPVVAYYLTSDIGSDPPMLDLLGVKEGQSGPFASGSSSLLGTNKGTGDRVKMLARSVLGLTD